MALPAVDKLSPADRANVDRTKAQNAAHAAKTGGVTSRLPVAAAATTPPAAQTAAAPLPASPTGAVPSATPAKTSPIAGVSPMTNTARVSASPADQAARAAIIAAAPLADRAALAKAEQPPADPARDNTFDSFGKYGVSATAPTPATRLPIDFKTAGFASQAEYDAARQPDVPNTTAASVMANTTSSRLPSASWTAAQDAANVQAAQIRANTPAPMTRAAAYELGNIHRADALQRLGTDRVRKDRIEGQIDAAKAYQIQNPVTRETNLADAKRNGTFEKTRDQYNKTNASTHLMDDTGTIHKLDDTTKQKMVTATAAVKHAESKAAAAQANAVYKFQNDRLKGLVGEQKAAEAAKKQQPTSVGANIAGLFGVAPKPFMMGGTVKAAAPVPRTDWLTPSQGRRPPTQPVTETPAVRPAGLPAAGRLGGLADWWASR